jgi:CheY-like chemotaxis protein
VPVVLEIGRDLPQIVGERLRIQQLCLNLLVNARDASRDRGGAIEVSLAETSSGGLLLAVADHGPGVPAELRQRIFEPYFTTRQRSGEGESWGAGLGLTIVDAVARATGATVRVDDRPGGGALFEVEWPTKAAMPASRARSSEPSADQEPALVLVADDEPALVGVLARHLRRAGHGVYAALSATECRRLFDQYGASIDVAVLDVMLGDGDGRELAREFRARRPELAIVLISASGARGLDGALRPTRGLAKPFEVAELHRAIAEAREAARSLVSE